MGSCSFVWQEIVTKSLELFIICQKVRFEQPVWNILPPVSKNTSDFRNFFCQPNCGPEQPSFGIKFVENQCLLAACSSNKVCQKTQILRQGVMFASVFPIRSSTTGLAPSYLTLLHVGLLKLSANCQQVLGCRCSAQKQPKQDKCEATYNLII